MPQSFVLAEPTTYNVLVHYHVMKNAGSTISEILKRELGPAYAEVHGPDAGSMIMPGELLGFIRTHPEIRVISSHHIRFPVPHEERLHWTYCCFLREPLDRLYSLYTFFRNSGDTNPVGMMAQRLDVRDFFWQLIEHFPNYACNAQTIYLACSGFFLRPAGSDDLQRAIRIMQECSMPGVVHRTNESLAIAEYFVNPIFPGIRLHGPAVNAGSDPCRSLESRQRELKDLLGYKLYRTLQKVNALDIALVRQTEIELARRRNLIANFSTRFAEFEQRCQTGAEHSAQPVEAT